MMDTFWQTDVGQRMARIPPVTRFLLLSTIACTLYGYFIGSRYLILWFPGSKIPLWQFWRVFTSYFVYPVKFQLLYHLYMLYTYSNELERRFFTPSNNRDTVDYVYYLLLTMVAATPLGYLLAQPLMGDTLDMIAIYLWSNMSPHQEISIIFNVTVKGSYFPYAYMVLYSIMNEGAMPTGLFIGLVVAFAWHNLDSVNPPGPRTPVGTRWLDTPKPLRAFLERLLGIESQPARQANGLTGGAAATGGSAPRPTGFNRFGARTTGLGGQPTAGTDGGPQPRPGHTWGTGRRLGD
ncbi:hypothetical protein GQ42DRAFT_143425 [Ramicandelaber brevisporus]|nr:hypothetical protein GQ42DRAFT_143425 [Ramicandelaber brevisporus]